MYLKQYKNMSCSEKESGLLELKQKSNKQSSGPQRILSSPHPSSFIHSLIQINNNQIQVAEITPESS